jgi:hypothetical protein
MTPSFMLNGTTMTPCSSTLRPISIVISDTARSLIVHSNSQLDTTAVNHPAAGARPDVSMGIVSSVLPDMLPGCKAGSLSLCFADGEVKRFRPDNNNNNNKSDEYAMI